jgi:hypothetical protein
VKISSKKPVSDSRVSPIWVKPVVTTDLNSTHTTAKGKCWITSLPPFGYRVMDWFERENQGKLLLAPWASKRQRSRSFDRATL